MSHKYINNSGLTYVFVKVKTYVQALLVGYSKSDHTHSNYVNQNAFSNVKVGSTTIAADSATDTLNLAAGDNITLTPDSANDKVTIAAKDTTYDAATTSVSGLMSASDKTKLDGIASGANKYTHPSYTARTGVPTANQTPAFGGTFSVSQPVSDATGHITAVNSRTVTIPNTEATTSAAGLMSASDKSKLDGIASGANKYTLPAAGSALGGVKSGGDVTISDGVITVKDDSHNHTIANVDGLQTALDSKETSGAAASALADANEYTDLAIAELVNSAPTTLDTLGEIATAMEENYDIVESLELAIGSKAAADHTHSNYASSVTTTGTGNAVTAVSQSGNKITVTKGSTFLTAHPTISKSTDSTSTASPAHGGTFTAIDGVTRDSNGHVTKVNTKTVTIPSTAATTSAAGLMSADDKTKLDGIATGANKYTHPSYTARTGKPTANATPAFGGTFTVSQITSDATGHVTGATDRTITIPSTAASTSAAGLMSATDKSKLDGIASGANKTTVDSALSSTSTNPVQNKVINSALAGKAASSHNHTIANVDGLQTALDGKAKKESGIFYVEGTSDTAGTWLGSHDDITEYYAGLMVAYKTNIAGASGLTLNINNLGAVSVVRNTTSAVTTHYGVGSVVFLVYTVDSNGTAYWKVSDYDSDTKTRSSNKSGSKMFIIGATTQSTSGQTTYSNSNCYIGTDNCLYSGGKKVATEAGANEYTDLAIAELINEVATTAEIDAALA